MKTATILLGLTALGLAGCSEYLSRRDTIAFGAGDAVAANIVTHVDDPWPPGVQDRRIVHNGERIRRGVSDYLYPPKQSGGVTATTTTTTTVGGN